jgi:hypothetical protein
MYGYESSATLTTGRLSYKLQTRLIIIEGVQDEQQGNFPAKERKKQNLVMGPKGVPDTQID